MKFIISSGTLYKSLQSIIGIIGSNNVLAILEDFKFDIGKNEIHISATDLETYMIVSITPDEVSGTGEICIPAKILMEFLKNVPEQPLKFEINKDLHIDITSSSGKSQMVGEDVKNFPPKPEISAKKEFSMSSAELSDGISKALVAVSTDSMRPSMNGVNFVLTGTDLTFVSTDAHRLVCCTKNGIQCPEETHFVAPRKALNQLKQILDGTSELTISYDENHLMVHGDRLVMTCRLIDDKFPDYQSVIPRDNPYKLQVSKADFLSSLRRVSVFANKTTYQVELDIKGSSLELNARDIDFSYEGEEKMNCQYDGEDMKIAFNARLLVDLIPLVEDDEFVLELSQPNRAGIIRPPAQSDDETLTMLVMPLMIHG